MVSLKRHIKKAQSLITSGLSKSASHQRSLMSRLARTGKHEKTSPKADKSSNVSPILLSLEPKKGATFPHKLTYFWRRYSGFMAQFYLTGFKRTLNNILSEGCTLACLGGIGLLALAIPSIQLTKDDSWKATGRYSVQFLDRYGNTIGHRGILHDSKIELKHIPDHLIKAVMATEDRRFFSHQGIDPFGLGRAMITNIRAGGVVQGGSTITQQLAKLLFLSSERTLDRKIKEAFLSFWLEQKLSKEEILKLYLDRAYLGGGTHGIEAASQYYFGKSVRDVSLAEAAMMAGLLKAPTKLSPYNDLPSSRARANEVLDNMVEAGFLTEGQVHGARLNPATPIARVQTFDSPDFFLDWAFTETQRLANKLEGNDYTLTVQTTVDTKIQDYAKDAIHNMLRRNRRAKRVSQSALVTMEHDGAVRALIGGRDYGESQFNRAVNAMRQPGSSFKPYVYLAAVERGYRPNSKVSDYPVWCGRWSPQNYDRRFRGRMNLSYALAKSINSVPVRLANKIGRKHIRTVTTKLGLPKIKVNCTMPLGTDEVTLLQHTQAYATFANGGLKTRAYGVLEIRNSQGKVIYKRDPNKRPERIFKKKHIAALNKMLGQVTTAGTGRRAQLELTTTAGKTGTSQNYRDAWFMGYTGQLVTGVWFGNDNYSPTKRVTGGSLPAMTWQEVMHRSHTSPFIPKIAGLPIHPHQISEMTRLKHLKKSNSALARKGQDNNVMPDKTLNMLKGLKSLFVSGRVLKKNEKQSSLVSDRRLSKQ